MADIETAYDAAIKAGKINGAILCATNASGQFTYNATLGHRTLLSGSKQSYRTDDLVFLASATKFMTTLAALACVEDGLLSLTGPLSSIAPELDAKPVLTGYTSTGDPLYEQQVRPITLEMLLTHSSGLVYHFQNPTIARWRQANPSISATGEDIFTVEERVHYPLAFQPGSSWMYGTGLDWAGRIVERVTKCSLGEFLQNRVWSRVGVHEAAFYPVTDPVLRAKMVDLNPADPEGLGIAVTGMGEMNKLSKGDFGGHGLFITLEGFVKVMQSVLANDGRIFEKTTVEDMFKNHLSTEAQTGLEQQLSGPIGHFFRCGIAEGAPAGHGLGGLLTLSDVEGWYGSHTISWGGGLSLAFFIDRKNDLCGFAAPQSTLPLDVPLLSELKQTFRTDIYRKYEAWKGSRHS